MSGPTPFSSAFSNSTIGSLRYNTSQYGSPLPIVYGTGRVSINLLEFFAFLSGSSKKSISSKKSGSKYTVYVAFAVCQGPVAFGTGGGFNRLWSNGGIAQINDVNLGLNLYVGNDSQAPDSNFVSFPDPNQPVIGYSSTCYVTGTPMLLGTAPVLPDISFEITGIGANLNSTNLPNANDARPDTIIVDLLTNSRYGPGFPVANLDVGITTIGSSSASLGNYCLAFGLGMSMVMDRSAAVTTWLDEMCKLLVVAPFWSGGTLKIVPYSATPTTGGGAAFIPNTTPAYALTNDHFLPWDDTGQGSRRGEGQSTDPVQITRDDPAKITNWMALEYLDTGNSYNPAFVEAFDQSFIDQFGLHSEPPMQGHWFSWLNSAQTSCSLQLQRGINVRNKYKFKLPWSFCLLDPMDIVTLTDANQAALTGLPVRIIGITENENGELEIDAEDLPGQIAGAPPAYASQPAPDGNSSSSSFQSFGVPGNANAPVMFVPPTALTGGVPALWILSSGSVDWGGAQVWMSFDGGSTYGQVGTLLAGSQQGVLTAALAAYGGTNPDMTDTISVDLTESLGELISVGVTAAANFVSLCYIDDAGGEFIAYTTATLTGPNAYNLPGPGAGNGLYRGLYGTTAGAHSIGAKFVYVGNNAGAPNIFSYQFPSNLVGVTVYIKLVSFNNFGQNLQDISVVAAYPFTIT